MKNVVILDDFYKDPNLVRELALQASYQDVTTLNYPGIQSDVEFYNEEICKRFEALLNEPLDFDGNRLTFGKFRFMSEFSGSRLKIHIDGISDWTGLIYLNLPNQCKGGTAFYRHKKTGMEGPPKPESLEKMGFSSYKEFEEQVVIKDSLDISKWEQTFFIGMKFNRLVLFKGNENFHCHTCSFGNTFENSRLTQNFFFNTKK